MKQLTPAERDALKVVLVNFKRFWHSGLNTVYEDTNADKLIDSIVELAKEMDDA